MHALRIEPGVVLPDWSLADHALLARALGEIAARWRGLVRVTSWQRNPNPTRSWHVPGLAADIGLALLEEPDREELRRIVSQVCDLWEIERGRRLLQWQPERAGQPLRTRSGDIITPTGDCIHVEVDRGNLSALIEQGPDGSWRRRT